MTLQQTIDEQDKRLDKVITHELGCDLMPGEPGECTCNVREMKSYLKKRDQAIIEAVVKQIDKLYDELYDKFQDNSGYTDMLFIFQDQLKERLEKK